MLSVAVLLDEEGAGRTGLVAVTRVHDRVPAVVRARARLGADGRARAARDGREQHVGAARARKLVERHLGHEDDDENQVHVDEVTFRVSYSVS